MVYKSALFEGRTASSPPGGPSAKLLSKVSWNAHITFPIPLRICGKGIFSIKVSPFVQINLRHRPQGKRKIAVKTQTARRFYMPHQLEGYTDR
jgi:hypothetical protein